MYFDYCFNISESDNRATAGVAADASFQDAILPYALTLEEHIDIEVVQKYCPGFRTALADTEPRTEAEESKRAIDVFSSGIASRDEAREMAGLPPVGGDEGAAFADGKLAEHATDLGELDEGYKKSRHDQRAATAVQQLSLEFDE